MVNLDHLVRLRLQRDVKHLCASPTLLRLAGGHKFPHRPQRLVRRS